MSWTRPTYLRPRTDLASHAPAHIDCIYYVRERSFHSSSSTGPGHRTQVPEADMEFRGSSPLSSPLFFRAIGAGALASKPPPRPATQRPKGALKAEGGEGRKSKIGRMRLPTEGCAAAHGVDGPSALTAQIAHFDCTLRSPPQKLYQLHFRN